MSEMIPVSRIGISNLESRGEVMEPLRAGQEVWDLISPCVNGHGVLADLLDHPVRPMIDKIMSLMWDGKPAWVIDPIFARLQEIERN